MATFLANGIHYPTAAARYTAQSGVEVVAVKQKQKRKPKQKKAVQKATAWDEVPTRNYAYPYINDQVNSFNINL